MAVPPRELAPLISLFSVAKVRENTAAAAAVAAAGVLSEQRRRRRPYSAALEASKGSSARRGSQELPSRED